MMDSDHNLPSEETVRVLLDAIAPGSTLSAIRPLDGSYSNWTHLVEANSATGARLRIVVRRYTSGDRARKAVVEFRTLELLQGYDVPAPQPLYLDEDGTLLGRPGIVTSYVSGRQIMQPTNPPENPLEWGRALARMLAKIHSIPCDSTAKGFLLDANSEAVWFLRSGTVPDYMSAHPDGAALWHTVRALLPALTPVEPALVHLDYWPGNVLWDQGQISAVVDWEEAACGDPGIDVAYCYMDMFLSGMGEAAKVFLGTYEAEMGRPVANLGFWELAAARPMSDPEWWIPVQQAFSRFIENARRRAGRH